MKVPTSLCCATLAFVNNRLDISSGGKRYSSHLCTQKQPFFAFDDNEHTIGGASDDGKPNNMHGHSHRRKFVQTISNSLLGSMLLLNAESARAACLAGDIRAECIGVYKLPMDAPETPYIDTPEKLKVYAPDINWVPPPSLPPTYTDAFIQLKDQRQQLDVAQDYIAKGGIENAGLVMLDIVPKVTAAGKVIVKAFNFESNNERNLAMKMHMKRKDINSEEDPDINPSSTPKALSLEMKTYRIEYSLNELLGYLGELDILIGQGLRGDLGVSAPAQIEILSNFPDCRKEFDNLISAVPDTVSA